jgi:serine/threonine protein kinase
MYIKMFCGLCTFRKRSSVLRTGNVFEDYDVKKMVGKGTYGEVWKSFNKQTGDCVAIKFATSQMSNSALKREYLHLDMFDHDCIIKPIDFYQTSFTYQLVLPFYKHDLLDYIMEIDRISDRDLWMISHRIGSAIHHMHSRHICHRDIKPENIMFDKSVDDCVLIDMGLAKHEDLITTTSICGSLVYIAPEVADAVVRSHHDTFLVGKMADMYALGCTLYSIATKSCTIGISKSSEIYKIIDNDMTLKIFVMNRPEPFKNLLRGLLCLSPLDRLTSEEMISHEYFNLTA